MNKKKTDDVGFHFVKQRLSEQRQLSDDAALLRYLEALKNTYHEFEYAPANAELKQLGSGHNDIDLTSSATSLPVHPKAAKASAEAVSHQQQQYYGKLEALRQNARETRDAGAYYSEALAELFKVNKRNIDEVNLPGVLKLLGGALSEMTPQQSEALKKAYQNQMHPVVIDCLDNCHKREFRPALPTAERDLRIVREHAIQLTMAACHEMLDGKYSKTEGLANKYERLRRESKQEGERIDQALTVGSDAAHQRLVPVVAQTMGHLQGWEAKAIKPENICIATGSSTHLMDNALQIATQSKQNHWRLPAEKKKLLSFTTSWDGLKIVAGDVGLEPSFINGAVNATALEAHIKDKILSGKYPEGSDEARAEVRKKVAALVVNIPENPLGKVPSDAEMKALAGVIAKYDIPFVAVDEIFAVPGYKSLATYPDMAERCYTVSSTSKNIPHKDRLAFGYSDNDALAKKIAHAIKEERPLNPVLAKGMEVLLQETPQDYYHANQQAYRDKQQMLTRQMQQVNKKLGIDNAVQWHAEPNYGCLGVVTFSKELTDKCGISSSNQLAEYLYKMGGVKTVPTGDITPNASEPIGVRINFSGNNAILTEAVERLGVAAKAMAKPTKYADIEGAKFRGEPLRESQDILSMFLDFLGTSPDQRAKLMR